MPNDDDRDSHPHALEWPVYVLLLGGAICTVIGALLLLAWAGSWIGGM